MDSQFREFFKFIFIINRFALARITYKNIIELIKVSIDVVLKDHRPSDASFGHDVNFDTHIMVSGRSVLGFNELASHLQTAYNIPSPKIVEFLHQCVEYCVDAHLPDRIRRKSNVQSAIIRPLKNFISHSLETPASAQSKKTEPVIRIEPPLLAEIINTLNIPPLNNIHLFNRLYGVIQFYLDGQKIGAPKPYYFLRLPNGRSVESANIICPTIIHFDHNKLFVNSPYLIDNVDDVTEVCILLTPSFPNYLVRYKLGHERINISESNLKCGMFDVAFESIIPALSCIGDLNILPYEIIQKGAKAIVRRIDRLSMLDGDLAVMKSVAISLYANGYGPLLAVSPNPDQTQPNTRGNFHFHFSPTDQGTPQNHLFPSLEDAYHQVYFEAVPFSIIKSWITETFLIDRTYEPNLIQGEEYADGVEFRFQLRDTGFGIRYWVVIEGDGTTRQQSCSLYEDANYQNLIAKFPFHYSQQLPFLLKIDEITKNFLESLSLRENTILIDVQVVVIHPHRGDPLRFELGGQLIPYGAITRIQAQINLSSRMVETAMIFNESLNSSIDYGINSNARLILINPPPDAEKYLFDSSDIWSEVEIHSQIHVEGDSNEILNVRVGQGDLYYISLEGDKLFVPAIDDRTKSIIYVRNKGVYRIASHNQNEFSMTGYNKLQITIQRNSPPIPVQAVTVIFQRLADINHAPYEQFGLNVGDNYDISKFVTQFSSAPSPILKMGMSADGSELSIEFHNFQFTLTVGHVFQHPTLDVACIPSAFISGKTSLSSAEIDAWQITIPSKGLKVNAVWI